MTRTDGYGRTEDDERAHDEELAVVSAVRTAPGRTVFTEDGNADGWVSTDHTVDVEP